MTTADLWSVGALAVLLAVLLVLTTGLLVRERRLTRELRLVTAVREHPGDGADGADEPVVRRAAIVVNPTKFAHLDEQTLARRQAFVAAVFRANGWADPRWLSTTPEEHGTSQARQAVADGASLVVAAGGDGTVRAVAAGLVGTDVPMGLLPAGTGNLLARNLDVPFADLTAALDLLFTAPAQRVDVGWLEVDRSGSDPEPDRHLFTVMAGLGFDAAMIAGAEDRLKRRLGYGAYVVSGARALWGAQTKVRVRIDDEPAVTARTRAVIVGNCGKLTKQLVLMPDARVDDGRLDAVLLSPRGGIGWGEVAWAIVTRDRRGQRRVQHLTGRRFDVTCSDDQEVQVDGDPVGAARRVSSWVQEGALLVVCPPLPAPAAHRSAAARRTAA